MLIDFSVQNFKSFNKKQSLNMRASTSTKEVCELNNLVDFNSHGINSLLKSAAIFGANGSGKTNFVQAMIVLKMIVLRSLDSIEDDSIKVVIPFLIKEYEYDISCEFEVTFFAEGGVFRYGISIVDGIIEEEWLYWTKTAREVMLFHRDNQTIEYNGRSFFEAKLFVRKEEGKYILEKTKPHVPFISVLSAFDGEKSTVVTDWFQKLHPISGVKDADYKNFTIKLFEENSEFKRWALDVLKSIQIDDVEVVEFEDSFPLSSQKNKLNDKELIDILSRLEGYSKKKKLKTLQIVKKHNNESYSLPLFLESEGTVKLIFLLGPLYDVIQKGEILVIDEFDNKFHTLLCKFLIEFYNKCNNGQSQLILTCHDTNLLTNELFRRDQIWFVEKNSSHESELFSLVEYKEHYTRKDKNYSKDYLAGKYGAVPLFDTSSILEDFKDG